MNAFKRQRKSRSSAPAPILGNIHSLWIFFFWPFGEEVRQSVNIRGKHLCKIVQMWYLSTDVQLRYAATSGGRHTEFATSAQYTIRLL